MYEREEHHSCGAAGETGRFRLDRVECRDQEGEAGPSIVKVHAHCHACDSDFVAREPIGLTAVSGGAVLSCTHCSNRQAIGKGVFDDLPASGRSPASRNTGA